MTANLAAKEGNREFIVDFLRKATSLKEADQDEAIDKVRDVFMVLGPERAVSEALPIMVQFSSFLANFRIIKLLAVVPIIDFELKKPGVVDGLFNFFVEFLNSEDEEVRQAAIRKVAALLTTTQDVRRFQNFLWGLHSSEGVFRRTCIFDFLAADGLSPEFFTQSTFFEEFFERLLEEPSATMRRRSAKLLFQLMAKYPNLFSGKFLKGAAKKLSDDKTPAVAMAALPLALKSGEVLLVDDLFAKAIKSKNPYLLKTLFDNLEGVKAVRPAVFKEGFVEGLCALFFEADNDLRFMALDALPLAIKMAENDTVTAKLINSVKQATQNGTKELKYNVMTSLLRCAPSLSREQCIELILKHLVSFLREEQELYDVYFVQNIKPFVQKCGYDILRESLDGFFGTLVVHCSQSVG